MIQFFYHESAGAGMRGAFVDQGGLFSYIAPEARVPANHPLRKIRELVRDVLGELNRSLGKLYASEGRPSIPPEQLLSALLLQVFYGIRSERQLMEQLDYNLLYRNRGLTCGWLRSLVMNLVNTSPFCSRSRFFVKVVGSQIGSSGESPTNQRYKRL